MKNQSFASNVTVTLQVLKRVPSYDSEQWFTLGKLAGKDSHDLSKYGSKDGPPASLGGSWLYEERFTQWQEQQEAD
jgi:hypothetical protein